MGNVAIGIGFRALQLSAKYCTSTEEGLLEFIVVETMMSDQTNNVSYVWDSRLQYWRFPRVELQRKSLPDY